MPAESFRLNGSLDTQTGPQLAAVPTDSSISWPGCKVTLGSWAEEFDIPPFARLKSLKYCSQKLPSCRLEAVALCKTKNSSPVILTCVMVSSLASGVSANVTDCKLQLQPTAISIRNNTRAYFFIKTNLYDDVGR